MSNWADRHLQGGKLFWFAIRSDGSEVSFHADSATVESGCLCLWKTSLHQGLDKPRIPLTEPQLVYSIASGGWKTFWSASTLDGRAIAVDSDSGDVDGCNQIRDHEGRGR